MRECYITYCNVCKKDIKQGYYGVHKTTKTHKRLESFQANCKNCCIPMHTVEMGMGVTHTTKPCLECGGGHYVVVLTNHNLEVEACCNCFMTREIPTTVLTHF